MCLYLWFWGTEKCNRGDDSQSTLSTNKELLQVISSRYENLRSNMKNIPSVIFSESGQRIEDCPVGKNNLKSLHGTVKGAKTKQSDSSCVSCNIAADMATEMDM